MTFRVVSKPSNSHVRCPYRVIERSTGREIEWINQYLDYETLRRLAVATLRTYADALLHFLRWWESVHHTDAVTKDALTESTLLDYVRFQASQEHELTGHDQPTCGHRRSCLAHRLSWCPWPDRSGAPVDVLAASAHGHRQAATRLKPMACQDCQTNHRAFVRGRSGAILVQLSELSGPGDRGGDAAARASLARGPGSAAGRFVVVGIADP